jgi:hypothetical protein
LTLDGTLAVLLINGFSPTAGNSFDILDWGSLSGTFATLQLPALGADLMWNASQLYTAGVLSVGLAGDYNLNGVVDSADYVVWRNMLGQIGTALAADGNANGQIDNGDYNVWRSHFGQSAGSGSLVADSVSFSSAVPEPAGIVVLFGAAAAMVLQRRRRRLA